ncbi:hypothetical protein TIFTF001_016585 [Ficus carica]|uniref:Ubiquitin-like protease family profile domain-containing protein n=1 Tax=Ficus carica TaxID=3494 RepID=A0AA88DIV6_FICCA|nr:hypothetical protein TIFTF001_016585 [Ficus carica]
MLTPTKMSEKNTNLEKKPVRVKSTKSSSADKSPKNMKRKHEEVDVNDSKSEEVMKSEEIFHNIAMRLISHRGMGDALCFGLGEAVSRFSINEFCLITGLNCVGSTLLPVVKSRLITRYFSTLRGVSRENLEVQMSNAKFDNDNDAVKLSLLYIMFSISLSNASAVKIGPQFFALADDLDAFNSFPWGVLSWEATRAAICHTVDNRMSSKKRPLKKNATVHYSLPGFPHALLVWAYETIPSITTKFTTKYEPAIPRMTSWTTAKNVKFNDVVAAFTTLGEDEYNDFVLLPAEEELKNPWIARLFSKSPTATALLPPPKSSVTRPSTDTKFEWREFQTKIRGQVASLNKKLEDLKREQKQSNKLLRRLIKLLSADKSEKGEGKAEPAPPVSSGHEINAERDELDAMKTTSPDIGSVADIGVQAAMEFLTADKVIVSHEDAENDRNQAVFVPTKKVDEGERIPEGEGEGIETKDEKFEEQLVSKVAEPGNDESSDVVETSSDVIPKKKRARLSRLGHRPARPMIDVGSPSTGPPKQINALPRGLDDEPPEETLEEFREWIKKGLLKKPPSGKRPPRYGAKYETLDKYHDLGIMKVDNKTWYYELATSPVWLWDEHIDVVFYYLRKKIRQFPELEKRKVTTMDTFSVRRLMLGVNVQSGSSWFQVNTLLILIHFDDLKHWALVNLELANWTIEVYDSMQHKGPHNSKVRGGMDALSKFIPLLAERLSLFEFKPREPPGTYPIPVTIMADIPRQGNGAGCPVLGNPGPHANIQGVVNLLSLGPCKAKA